MAVIQFKRQLKFAHSKDEAIKYIKNKLIMFSGEPLICTYKNSNGKWGAIEVICVYPKGTPKQQTIITDENYFENEILKENFIKINADVPIWEEI